jgi:thiosulfate dehydrogenase [quinone] large subunit
MATPSDSARSPENAPCRANPCLSWLPPGASLAFITLRLWLACRAIFAGLEKFTGFTMTQTPLLDEFGNPDATGAIVETKVKVYGLAHYHGLAPSLDEALRAEPLMPGWALTAYSGALGPLLLLTGIALLLGLAPRLTLLVQGLIYATLTIGLILINQDSGVAALAIHTLLVALALKWVDHNRWSACSRCAKY